MRGIARATAEGEYFHVQTFVEQKLDGALGGVGSGIVGIEIHHHGIGVPVQWRGLAYWLKRYRNWPLLLLLPPHRPL